MTVTDGLRLGVDALLRDFRPLSLADLEGRAALMDREDRKYVVPLPILAELLSTLQDRMQVLEVDGRRSSRYDSTYFDTTGAQLFRAHAQGRRLRYKVRTREYSDLGTRYVEVKLKGARGRTIKVRQPCGETEHRHGGPAVLAFTAHAVGAQYGQPPTDHLVPALSVRYERSTLVANTDELRVTIDGNLSFATPDARQVARLKDGLVLVEVKSPSGRSEVDTLLLRRGMRPQSFSKYSLGLISARDDVPSADLRWAAHRYLDVSPPHQPARPPQQPAQRHDAEGRAFTDSIVDDAAPAVGRGEGVGEAVARMLALARREAARIVADAQREAATLRAAATADSVTPLNAEQEHQRAVRLEQAVAELRAQRDSAGADLQRILMERDTAITQVQQARQETRQLAAALQALIPGLHAGQ